MKTNNIPAVVWNLAFSAAFAALTALPVPAMSQSPTSAAPVPVPQRMNIDFGENTPLQDAVNHLQGMFRQRGEPVNALVKGDATAITVPVMSRQEVTFEQGIKAVALACDSPVEVTQAGPNVLMIRVSTLEEQQARATKLKAYNIADFLLREGKAKAGERLEKLQAAISTGIMARRKISSVTEPVLEAHLEGGLLFAQGDATALEVVTEVVQAICPTSSASHPAKP